MAAQRCSAFSKCAKTPNASVQFEQTEDIDRIIRLDRTPGPAPILWSHQYGSALIISISSHSVLLTSDLHEFVDKAIRAQLDHLGEHVLSKDVALNDAYALLGGSDKRVVVRVHLRDGRPLIVKSMAEDIDAAVLRGAKLASRAVRRCSGESRLSETLSVFGQLEDHRLHRLPSQAGA